LDREQLDPPLSGKVAQFATFAPRRLCHYQNDHRAIDWDEELSSLSSSRAVFDDPATRRRVTNMHNVVAAVEVIKMLVRTATVMLALVLTLATSAAHAQASPTVCGSLDNQGNGPFDYRVDRDKLKVVEGFHFTPRVEALISGQSAPIAMDLDFVLRAFPNHHRALIAMSRLGVRTKSLTPPQSPRSVDCYFERALRFRRDDAVARMLFASYLRDINRLPDALREVEQAIEIGRDNAFTQYNAGLLLAEMGQFDRALLQAHRAQAMGFTRPELKAKLQAVGKWVDPPDEAAAVTEAASSGGAAEPAAAASASGGS